MAVLPPPDQTVRYTQDNSGVPTAQFYNWIKQLGDTVKQLATSVNQLNATVNTLISGGATVVPNYSEGSWTPDFRINHSNAGVSYVNQQGVYIKLNKLVFLGGWVQLSNNGFNAGNASIGNLPFVANPGVPYYFVSVVTANTSGLPTPSTSLFGAIDTTVPTEVQLFANEGDVNVQLTDAIINNNSFVYCSGTYGAAV